MKYTHIEETSIVTNEMLKYLKKRKPNLKIIQCKKKSDWIIGYLFYNGRNSG